MRLLLLTDDYLPHWGGSRVYYHELLSRMARRGDCVCVATRRRAGSSEFDAAQPYQVVRAPLPEAAWLRPLRLQALPTYVGLVWLALRATWRMLRTGGRPDSVLAGELVPTGPVAALLAFLLRRPLIVFTHAEGPATLARTRWQSRLARWVCGRAVAVVVSSDTARASLVGMLHVADNKIQTILPGVGEEHFDERWRAQPGEHAHDEPGRPRLLSVGRLIARKGHATVIEALPALLERLPGLVYRIVGTGPLEATLCEQARRCGVADHVEFVRADPAEDLLREYCEADCFVLPNRDDPATGDTDT